jgi:two-component system response regulator YesN
MYRVLIADDEDIIREGFIEFIPWAELGFEIVYTCENGTQAIEYLKENSVDFILTDIIMAGTTGLDIARYVYENNISSVVCLVSGHRDFEYARQAIKYNVNYYLTKPTDFDDMLEMINEVKKTLDSRKISSEETFALQESFFLDFFIGNHTDYDKIVLMAHQLGFNPDKMFICPFWITVKNFDKYIEEKWNYGKELLFTAILNFLRDGLKQFTIYNIMINNNEGLFIAVLNQTENSVEDILNSSLDSVCESIQYLMELTISYKLGMAFSNLKDFAEHLSTAALVDAYNETSDVFHGRILLMEIYKNIMSSLILGNKDRLSALIKNLEHQLSEIDIKTIKSYLSELAEIVFDKLKNIGGWTFEDIYQAYLNNINSVSDKKELFDISRSFLFNVSENINMKTPSSEAIIKQIKDYISVHYADNISLNDVANTVFLNASYLSRLFKQCTGENFRDYLINVRISKAIELIEQKKYKIYEISEICGYKNPKYFAQQFKQVTGISPREYLRQKD